MNGLVYKSDVVGMIYEVSETATCDDENLLADLETKVNDMSDVPAKENTEAHWIKHRTNMECSRCGNEFVIKSNGFCNLTRYDYCPCCGSWMHGNDYTEK